MKTHLRVDLLLLLADVQLSLFQKLQHLPLNFCIKKLSGKMKKVFIFLELGLSGHNRVL